MQSWVPSLERLLEIVQQGAHETFRCVPALVCFTDMRCSKELILQTMIYFQHLCCFFSWRMRDDLTFSSSSGSSLRVVRQMLHLS